MSSNYDAYSKALDSLVRVADAAFTVFPSARDEAVAAVVLESVKDELTAEKAAGLLIVAAVRLARARQEGGWSPQERRWLDADPDTAKETLGKVFGES